MMRAGDMFPLTYVDDKKTNYYTFYNKYLDFVYNVHVFIIDVRGKLTTAIYTAITIALLFRRRGAI